MPCLCLLFIFTLRPCGVCVLLKEVMSSLRPSYCKKSSNDITSARGTPTERSVVQNSCRWNQIHPAVLLPVLFPNGFYLGTFPLEIRMRSPLHVMSVLVPPFARRPCPSLFKHSSVALVDLFVIKRLQDRSLTHLQRCQICI